MRVNLFRSLKRLNDAIVKMEAMTLTDEQCLELVDFKKFQSEITIDVLERAFVKEA